MVSLSYDAVKQTIAKMPETAIVPPEEKPNHYT